jgi:hypothetical protein
LFDANKAKVSDAVKQGTVRTAIQCAGEKLGAGYNQPQCGAGDVARITAPATLLVRASEKGPEVVAEDLYTVPSGLLLPKVKKRKMKDSLHVMPHERKKKIPTVDYTMKL